jgi:Calcineurin-like phosphoesterase
VRSVRVVCLLAMLGAAGCTDGGRALVSTSQSAVSGAAAVTWTSTELLGRPTDSSVTLQAIAAQPVEAYVEVGTSSGSYPSATSPATFSDGFVRIVVGSLSPDTAYVYRLRSRAAGATDAFAPGTEHHFHTQRARGQAFSFAVQADSHQNFPGFYDDGLYRSTMQNILAEGNDFMFDLGDAFSLDGASETTATVAQKYVNQLAVFGLAAHSTPVFLVLGNHEREEGWNLTELGADVADTLPILSANARKQYFLNPFPGPFYSGDTDTSGNAVYVSGDHLRGDYYAFEWGDALFVAIEPYWYSQKKPYAGALGGDLSTAPVGDRWDWTLGQQQYEWLRQTLAGSTARYKFVFAHHVAGGMDDYGRGGALAAKYCEWGGYDTDGQTWLFDSKRPGWEMPVHQVLAQNHVTAFFHAHDHAYARETLDGVTYQLVPMAANANYTKGFDTNPTDYAGATLIANSGHLKVTVSSGKVSVAYVRSFLPGDGVNGAIAATYDLQGPDSPDGGAGGAGGAPATGAAGAGGGGGTAGAAGGGGAGAAGSGGAAGQDAGAAGAGQAGAGGTSGSAGAAGGGGEAGSGGAGASGAAGVSGASGAGGTAGVNGAAGVSGASGAGGTAGVNGAAGVSGASGAGGAAGANGSGGATDTAGANGAGGAGGVAGNGATGGASGAGGPAGAGGPSGTSGTAGVSGGAGGAAGSGTAGAPGSGGVGTGGAGGIGTGVAGAGGHAGGHAGGGGHGASGGAPHGGDSGGCGCETGPAPTGSSGLLLVVGTVVLSGRRRQRRQP